MRRKKVMAGSFLLLAAIFFVTSFTNSPKSIDSAVIEGGGPMTIKSDRLEFVQG